MIELFAAIFTLACVLLLNVKNVWGWVVGIVAAILYSVVFYEVDLYGQVFLQLIFILQSIYGWWNWKRDSGQPQIECVKPGLLPKWITIITIVCVALWSTSVHLYTSQVEVALIWLDAYIVVLALLANWLLSLKIYQSWLIWIIVDILSIVLMISQDLWWSVGLYVLLLTNAVIAYRKWKLDYESERIRWESEHELE